MTGIVVAIFVALVLVWGVVTYNRLVRLRNKAEEAWSGIDVQLQRRADLVPVLVDTVQPYAVVFGAVDRWAKVFAELGVATTTAVGTWYVGSHGFDAARFSSGLSDFSSTLGTSLATVPSSSGGSSGFSGGSSGGGMGGGGGGSW